MRIFNRNIMSGKMRDFRVSLVARTPYATLLRNTISVCLCVSYLRCTHTHNVLIFPSGELPARSRLSHAERWQLSDCATWCTVYGNYEHFDFRFGLKMRAPKPFRQNIVLIFMHLHENWKKVSTNVFRRNI